MELKLQGLAQCYKMLKSFKPTAKWNLGCMDDVALDTKKLQWEGNPTSISHAFRNK